MGANERGRGAWSRWAGPTRTAAIVLVAAIAIAVLVFAVFGRDWMASGIAVAPNAHVAIRAEDDPSRADLDRLGVREQFRVDVGPPAASLAVWTVDPPGVPRATVLVLHGIRSDKYWQLGLARRVAAHGWRAVLPDLRGHGRSSGDWLTYGVVDARDLSQLLDALERAGRLVGHVGVIGTSYGAATAIELAAIDARVRGVVAIAPFSSLNDVVPAYVRHYAPLFGALVPRWFIADAIERAGRLGSFDPAAASPADAIGKAEARLLLIHGRADTNIPPAQSEAIRARAPDRARLILVDGADHFSIVGDPSGAIARDGMAHLEDTLK